jgi:hypothetical protein
MKWSLSAIVAIVGLGTALAGAAGSFAVAAYRINQLERKVESQTAVIESQQRTLTELVTALRYREILK